MTYHIPDPRFEAPDLLVPGRKPTTPVKIKRDHPLSRDLEVAVIFQSGIPYDFASEKMLTFEGDRSQITKLKDGIDFQGDARATYVHDLKSFTNSQRWTLTFEIEGDGDATEAIPFGENNTTGNYLWLRTTGLRVRTNANMDMTCITSYTTKTIYSIVCDNPGASGTFAGYSQGAFRCNSTSGSTAFNLSAIGAGYTTDAYTFDGRVHNYFVHSRELSAEEIARWHKNPYCVFEPA